MVLPVSYLNKRVQKSTKVVYKTNAMYAFYKGTTPIIYPCLLPAFKCIWMKIEHHSKIVFSLVCVGRESAEFDKTMLLSCSWTLILWDMGLFTYSDGFKAGPETINVCVWPKHASCYNAWHIDC